MDLRINLRESTYRLLRLAAVEVLLVDKLAISDGLEAELYVLKEQLEQQDADEQRQNVGHLTDMTRSLQLLPGAPDDAGQADDHRDVTF
jgi:hypothetical protein